MWGLGPVPPPWHGVREGTTGRMSAVVRARRHLKRLFIDVRGQDMIEYSLLALFFGIVGVIVWNLIGTDIQAALVNWDVNMQNDWEIPPPSGGS